jgi:hypothetical protein
MAGGRQAGPNRGERLGKEFGSPMVLEMRSTCERCGTPLAADGAATICSYECTFCTDCAEAMEHICPNCQGELVPRPRRALE